MNINSFIKQQAPRPLPVENIFSREEVKNGKYNLSEARSLGPWHNFQGM